VETGPGSGTDEQETHLDLGSWGPLPHVAFRIIEGIFLPGKAKRF